MPTPYALDHTGTLVANKITSEVHAISTPLISDYNYIVPTFAPFFTTGLIVSFKDTSNVTRTLVEGVDYLNVFQFIGASRSCAKPIYGGISFLNNALTGTIYLTYQTLGGSWTIDITKINTILSDTLRNPRETTWENVANPPTLFPVVDHEWNLVDMVGMSDVVASIDTVTTAIVDKVIPLTNQTTNKASIGLGNVDNYLTANDPETLTGVLSTKFTTPHGVKYAITQVLGNLDALYASFVKLLRNDGAGKIGTQVGLKLNSARLSVKTMSDLRALEIPDVVDTGTILVTVLGNSAFGDGILYTYYWDKLSVEINDNYNVVIPNTSAGVGRWINLEKSGWSNVAFIATVAQPSYELTEVPIQRSVPCIIVNNVVQLEYRSDFILDGKTIQFYYPFQAGDAVCIVNQTKENQGNPLNLWINKIYSVLSQTQVFVLPRKPLNNNQIKVILNDFIILNNVYDFTISDVNLTISYPIQAGDKLEVTTITNDLIKKW